MSRLKIKLRCCGQHAKYQGDLVEEIELEASEFINGGKWSRFTDVSLSFDYKNAVRLINRYGSLNEIIYNSKKHLKELRIGIPRSIKKKCLKNHFDQFNLSHNDDDQAYYEHLLYTIGVIVDVTNESNTSMQSLQQKQIPQEFELCPTLMDGFFGLEVVLRNVVQSNILPRSTRNSTKTADMFPDGGRNNSKDTGNTKKNTLSVPQFNIPRHVSAQELSTGYLPNLSFVKATDSQQILDDYDCFSAANLGRTVNDSSLNQYLFGRISDFQIPSKLLLNKAYPPTYLKKLLTFRRLRHIRKEKESILKKELPTKLWGGSQRAAKLNLWALPKDVSTDGDQRYLIEGSTRWAQICTSDGLKEIRRHLWCLDSCVKE